MCVDAEDRQALSLKLSGFHRSFISPWQDGASETLFSHGVPETFISIESTADITFLQKGQLDAGDSAELFYGFPIFIDRKDILTPLFFISVEATTLPNTVKLRLPDPNAIRFNHYLFKGRFAMDLEELQQVQLQLEGKFGSFAARIHEALKLLGTHENFNLTDPLEPFPNAGTRNNRWIHRGLLFRSERSDFTAHLRRELDALTRYQHLQEAIPQTALGALLQPANNVSRTEGNNRTICQIAPLNDIQYAAASAALRDTIVVVTGPPGTGKSQVIIDLLATCARDGTLVLFSSKNNKAVDVVSDRIRELLGEDDWTLRLGSSEHINKARKALKERLNGNASKYKNYTAENSRNIAIVIKTIEKRRQAVIDIMDRYGVSVEVRRQLELVTPQTWRDAVQPKNITKLRDFHERAYFEALALSGKEKLSLWIRLIQFIAPLWQRRQLRRQVDRIIHMMGPGFAMTLTSFETISDFTKLLSRIKVYLDWVTACNIEQELIFEINRLEPMAALETELRSAREALSTASILELAQSWTNRVQTQAARLNAKVASYFTANDTLLKGNASGAAFVEILNDAVTNLKALTTALSVWIVTTLSTRRGVPLAPALFELVVIDEASQCDIASAIPLLFRARRAVIIGDPKQLRHISTLHIDEEMHIRDSLSLQEYWKKGWRYSSYSIYDLAEHIQNGQGKLPYFLNEHYRSDGAIIGFSNRAFYGGRLVVKTDRKLLAQKGFELGIFWHDVVGAVPPGSRSAYNPIETEAIVKLVESWEKLLRAHPKTTIGIVTPFRRQMETLESAVLKSQILSDMLERIQIGTAHKFQGDECDIMVLSPVVADGIPQRLITWIAQTDQLLNVATTRARAALHIVGDLSTAIQAGGSLGALAKHVGVLDEAQEKTETPEERKIATILSDIGLYFRPQVRIGAYRLDFEVISPFGTAWALEIDGGQHYEEETLDRDEARSSFLRESGYRILRITNRDVRDHAEKVRSILEKLY